MSDHKLRHAAIIMDGNGRWAEKHGLSRSEGHRAGSDKVEVILETAREIGLEYLTLYAFSTENWKRPPEEVEALMTILDLFLTEKLPSLMAKKVRLMATGRIDELPAKVTENLRKTIEMTSENDGGTLILALNYGGRAELTDAAKKLAAKAVKGEIRPEDITEETVARELYCPEVPDVDLMIRTSGENRISNFLLWQLAYAEFYITDVLWPDFGREEFLAAIAEFGKRNRRFGSR